MNAIFKLIGWILKRFWKCLTFIRVALSNLFFLLFIVLICLFFINTDSPLPTVKPNSALVLNLSGPIVEQSSYSSTIDSLSGSLLGKEIQTENVLFNVVDTIRHAQHDENITGLVLRLKDMPETNLTKLRYIAKALNEFKASGKPIYAVSDFYNQSQYYLASYANQVLLSPDGAVMLQGYKAYSMFYKSILEKLNVSTHVFRVGTYKSAVEPFLRDDMSDEAKESTSRWLTQLWGAYVDDVAINRNIDKSKLTPSMDSFIQQLTDVGGDLAALSLKLGLVDTLATRQQANQLLIDVFGSDGKDSYNAIDYYSYHLTMPVKLYALYDIDDEESLEADHLEENTVSDGIGIIIASGTIMDGEQPKGTIGGDTLSARLRQARHDHRIKSVVLRVDSPGGSAFASEVIRNEIEMLRAANKPVVISMSSLAASGGYWISMSSDKIIAQPTTLTGSIGIFSVITTVEKSLNHIGINSDGVGTSPFSSIGITTGLSDEAAKAFQLSLEHGYQRFIGLVSQQRGLTINAVDAVAQGQVWTGQDALKHGLIDQIGDFDDAIASAAELAGLDQPFIYWVEEPLSPMQQFIESAMTQAQVHFGFDLSTLKTAWPLAWLTDNSLPTSLQPTAKQLLNDVDILSQFNDPKGRYAFCLNCQIH